MNLGVWNAQLIEAPGRDAKKLYIFRHLYNNDTEFLTENGKTVAVKEPAQDTDKHYFAMLTNEQIQSIANALADDGVHTANDHKNAGLLQATTKHLEDMRRLVFEPVTNVVVDTSALANTKPRRARASS